MHVPLCFSPCLAALRKQIDTTTSYLIWKNATGVLGTGTFAAINYCRVNHTGGQVNKATSVGKTKKEWQHPETGLQTSLGFVYLSVWRH